MCFQIDCLFIMINLSMYIYSVYFLSLQWFQDHIRYYQLELKIGSIRKQLFFAGIHMSKLKQENLQNDSKVAADKLLTWAAENLQCLHNFLVQISLLEKHSIFDYFKIHFSDFHSIRDYFMAPSNHGLYPFFRFNLIYYWRPL